MTQNRFFRYGSIDKKFLIHLALNQHLHRYIKIDTQRQYNTNAGFI